MTDQKNLPEVLILDSSKAWNSYFQSQLQNYANVICASIPSQAMRLFHSYRNLQAIVVHSIEQNAYKASPDQEMVTPRGFVRRVRKAGFTGSILATGNNWQRGQDLLQAGCNRDIGRIDVPRVVKEILGVTAPNASSARENAQSAVRQVSSPEANL